MMRCDITTMIAQTPVQTCVHAKRADRRDDDDVYAKTFNARTYSTRAQFVDTRTRILCENL